METVLYVAGALGLVGAMVLAALNALGHPLGADFALSIIAAVTAVLALGFGRALELLRTIDDGLRHEHQVPPGPAEDARVPPEPKDVPKRYRYGDLRIEAFADGTYVVSGPGMKPTRFKNQDALDDFLDEQSPDAWEKGTSARQNAEPTPP